ncbi:MAG: type II toxin-antitoxin system PemK/MazF family toxin [Acidobacteriota bacterium]|nr:type II toxin-antitoxin system PemK/MazF family toxin [Acidobacteriota bacterium]
MKRGDVFWADLEPRSGSEQRGRRPVIVVSNDGFNQTPGWRSVIVVPATTSERQGARGPTAVLLPKGAGGMKKESVALCHQVTTLDRGKLVEKVGSLTSEQLSLIVHGLKAALDMD